MTWSANGDPYHLDCWSSELDAASTVWHITADREPLALSVCSHGIYDRVWLEPYTGPLVIDRRWVATSPHRGHQRTRVRGFAEVLRGWTTGNWGDATSDSKQAFNQWVADLLEGGWEDLPENLEVLVVLDPTSNVFSTAVTVLANHPDDLGEVPSL